MSDCFVTPWMVACQSPLSMVFPRQEYWSGWPFPSLGIFPTQRSKSHQGQLSHGPGAIILAECLILTTASRYRHHYKWASRWCSGKESTCQCKRCEFNPWVGKILWRRKWLPTSVFCLENSMDRGVWQAIVHGVIKRWPQLSTHHYNQGKRETALSGHQQSTGPSAQRSRCPLLF